MRIEKQQEPQLSGAYIRNLVKHLTSSNTKQSMTSPKEGCVRGDNPNLNPNPGKKQVRRRLRTSRPYQERLLNMAEARREIVTALKFHRASMKQANERKEHRQHELEQHQPLKTEAIYSCGYPSYGSLHNHPSPIISDSPASVADFLLPHEPLGLNLNFHDFTNLDMDTNSSTSVYHPSSTSSSSTSSSQAGVIPAPEVHQPGLHHVMDDEEKMAEMRSIGDRHQMEWNDAMNMVTSARWCMFLNTMEIEPEEVQAQDFDGLHPFDEAMELPSWLNPSDVCFQQQQFYGYSSSHVPDLPRMDI